MEPRVQRVPLKRPRTQYEASVPCEVSRPNNHDDSEDLLRRRSSAYRPFVPQLPCIPPPLACDRNTNAATQSSQSAPSSLFFHRRRFLNPLPVNAAPIPSRRSCMEPIMVVDADAEPDDPPPPAAPSSAPNASSVNSNVSVNSGAPQNAAPALHVPCSPPPLDVPDPFDYLNGPLDTASDEGTASVEGSPSQFWDTSPGSCPPPPLHSPVYSPVMDPLLPTSPAIIPPPSPSMPPPSPPRSLSPALSDYSPRHSPFSDEPCPDSPYSPHSPPYSPNSPSYSPASPLYSPSSPAYCPSSPGLTLEENMPTYLPLCRAGPDQVSGRLSEMCRDNSLDYNTEEDDHVNEDCLLPRDSRHHQQCRTPMASCLDPNPFHCSPSSSTSGACRNPCTTMPARHFEAHCHCDSPHSNAKHISNHGQWQSSGCMPWRVCHGSHRHSQGKKRDKRDHLIRELQKKVAAFEQEMQLNSEKNMQLNHSLLTSLKTAEERCKELQEEVDRWQNTMRPSDVALQKMSHKDLELLLTRMRRAQEEVQAVKLERLLCVVCMEQEKEIVFVPCRHKCTCPRCAVKLDLCPLCRVSIDDRIQPY